MGRQPTITRSDADKSFLSHACLVVSVSTASQHSVGREGQGSTEAMCVYALLFLQFLDRISNTQYSRVLYSVDDSHLSWLGPLLNVQLYCTVCTVPT